MKTGRLPVASKRFFAPRRMACAEGSWSQSAYALVSTPNHNRRRVAHRSNHHIRLAGLLLDDVDIIELAEHGLDAQLLQLLRLLLVAHQRPNLVRRDIRALEQVGEHSAADVACSWWWWW